MPHGGAEAFLLAAVLAQLQCGAAGKGEKQPFQSQLGLEGRGTFRCLDELRAIFFSLCSADRSCAELAVCIPPTYLGPVVLVTAEDWAGCDEIARELCHVLAELEAGEAARCSTQAQRIWSTAGAAERATTLLEECDAFN